MKSSNSTLENEPISLCAPTPELTCFGCCPPIRPSHYDPLDFVSSLRREFIENRRSYVEQSPRPRPIVGYYCWALGFLDSQGRRIGCMLHPSQNGGRDLRSLIDYGNKCMRENCLPARIFSLLPPEGRLFWLPLAKGLNAFYFSSKRANPLFHLLLWGPEVLEAFRIKAEERQWSSTQVIERHSFLLSTDRDPRSMRYFLRLLIERASAGAILDMDFKDLCGKLWEAALCMPEVVEIKSLADYSYYFPFTHTLALDADYIDFVRIGLGFMRAPLPLLIKLEARIKKLLADMDRAER